jgi:hypothetical protein
LGLRVWALNVLCLLLASSAFAAQVTLAWDVNSDPAVVGYKLYYGLASQSYSVTIDVGSSTTAALSGLQPASTYYFAATDYDGHGQESGFSNEVSSTVPAADTTPPTVSITSPSDGALVKAKSIVTISATASDDVGVTKAKFYVNGRLKCSVATDPYTCAWTVPSKSGSTYRLQAKAYDAAGNIASSSIIGVRSQ